MNTHDARSETAEVIINQSKQLREHAQFLQAECQALLTALNLPCLKPGQERNR